MESTNNRIEIHAKDVEKAIDLAAVELDIDRDNLDITVLDNGDSDSESYARILATRPRSRHPAGRFLHFGRKLRQSHRRV